MQRVANVIEHGVVAVEAEEGAWTILMRDLSDALIPENLLVSRPDSRRILAAAAALDDEFQGEQLEGLCTLRDRYAFLSPASATQEQKKSDPVPKLIGRGWEIFFETVPEDV